MRDVYLVNPVVYNSLDLFPCAVRAWTKFESARLDPFSPTKWRHLEEISTHLPLDLAYLLHKMEDFSGKTLIFVFINACRLSSQDCKSDLNAEIFEIYPFRRWDQIVSFSHIAVVSKKLVWLMKEAFCSDIFIWMQSWMFVVRHCNSFIAHFFPVRHPKAKMSSLKNVVC